MLAPSHPSWDPRVVMRETKSAAKLGHQMGLVAMHDDSREFPEGIELLPLPRERVPRWKRIKLMRRVYRMARRWPADVYHAHEVESLAVGILLKWRTGAKLIFDSHECFHYTAARYLSGWKARLVTALMKRVMKCLSRRADQVIVVSYTSQTFYREFCGCRKVTIIHNSPLPELFPCNEKTPEARRTLIHNSFLSVGRGMHQLLEALALVKKDMPVRFINVGMIDKSDQAEFDRRVRELGLQDEVEVTGWLDYEQVGPEMNRGTIGLMALQPEPNNYATLHNKLFNYMCTGLAVIGPKGSDTEQVLQHADCGVAVDMTDPQALAEVIRSLLREPERTRQMGLNGRKAVETEFGWHQMEKLLDQIYKDLGA